MRTELLTAVAAVALVSGCATTLSNEFGVSTNSVGFGCSGEIWRSQEANEVVCIVRSKTDPNRFLIHQNSGEVWGDIALNFITLGAHGLFDLDDDTPEIWHTAADQYMRRHYGINAKMLEFHRVGNKNDEAEAYVFEVLPGDQTPTQSVLDVQKEDEIIEKNEVQIEVLEVQIEVLDEPITED